MSVINQFNKLGGASVTREDLHKLQDKAYDEQQAGNKNAMQVWSRIQNLLDAYPDADIFELELSEPINEFSSLGKIEVITKGNDLSYYQDQTKLATINKNGVITYHKKKMPAGLRKEIRKAADIIGLACPEIPVEESMLHGIEYIENDDEFTGLGKPVSPTDIYNYVTDLILNTIKTVGHLPWQKEWIGSGSNGEAKNYVTKKPYNGINFVLLNFDIKLDKQGKGYLVPKTFKKPYYLTFNQIEEAKATLKTGSKAHRVIYYTMIFGFKNGDLEISTSDKGKYTTFIQSNGITPAEIKEFGKKIPVVKYYNVYRADDCAGLKFPFEPKPKTTSPIEQAQAIIDGYPNHPKYTFVGADAYYQPANDLVNMPKISAFTKEQFYYSTFFHEIVHSTGHSKRLDRGNDTRKRDGGKEDKKAYAYEELVAELGAVFLCSEAGILFTTVENSAKYLKGWNSRLITELQNDNRFFLKASAQAQKAANWILDRNQDKDQVTKSSKVKKAAPVPAVKKTAKTVTNTIKIVPKKVVSVQKKLSKGTKAVNDACQKIVNRFENKVIKVTAAQKKRYAKELASDNWKKYSKNPDGNKKFKVLVNQYLPNGKVSNYYYVVNHKGETINKQTTKVYRGNNLALYKFTTKDSAQKFANKLISISKKDRIETNTKIEKFVANFPKRPRSGKQLKIALGKPIEILASPIQDNIPIYINAPMDDKTKEIVDIIKETVPTEAIFVHQPEKDLNANPNSLAARKKIVNKPREFYIIENRDIARLLGNIERKEKESVAITIAGGQGSGKTSFVFQCINEFAKNYKVGHASMEEHPESSLYENKAERYWNENAINTVDAPEIKTINDLDALIKRNDVIVIDSFSKLRSMLRTLTLDDDLRKKYDGKLFIIIYQLTTNNTMRGGSDSQFDGDTVLFVEKFPDFNENYVYVDKNRYATDISPDLKYNISKQALENNTEELDPKEIVLSQEIEKI